MKDWERWIIYPLLTVCLIVSLVSICHTHPRIESGFDYMGLIIGILTLLVTMLIGWQIYNALSLDQKVSDIKKEYDGLKDKSEALARQQENIKVYNEASMEFIQGVTMLSNRNSVNLAETYWIFSLALLHYIEADIDLEINAENCLRNMDCALSESPERWHYGSHKAEIDGVIAQIWEKKGLSCRLVEILTKLESHRRDFRQ